MRGSGKDFVGTASRTDRRTLLRGMALGVASAVGMGSLPSLQESARAALAVSSQVSGPGPDHIVVFPPHQTVTASPATEISFRGVSPELLGPVRVVGGRSGGHSGILSRHADGRGVSFLPDAPFEPGERVTVSADVALGETPSGSVTFTVARPASRVPAPGRRETRAPESPPQRFRSRPDLRPPVISITTEAAGTAAGLIFVTPNVPGGQSGAMILDDQGDTVWYSPPDVDLNQIYDFRVQEYHGQPVLTWSEGAGPVGYGYGHFVIMNTSYQRIAELQIGNGFPGGDVHEFLLTPHGTALVLIYNAVQWNLSDIGGPISGIVLDGIVQEIEIETGHVLFEWHALDHIELDETRSSPPKKFGTPLDYVHLNSIAVDRDGGLILSARHTDAIYKVDRATGEIVWRLNGKRSDFRMGPNTRFAWQHDARRQPDGRLTLFDNARGNVNQGGHSRGMVLDLDMEAMTATLVRQFIHPTAILSASQGNMQQLPNGNYFMGWGSAPVFSEFSPDGDLRFNGRFPRGVMTYRAYRAPWSGFPTEPPDIAVVAGEGDAVTVHASWNGATGVAGWRVLSGPGPNRLGRVHFTVTPRTGFETAIELRLRQPWVAVEAVNEGGRVLATSEAVRVR